MKKYLLTIICLFLLYGVIEGQDHPMMPPASPMPPMRGEGKLSEESEKEAIEFLSYFIESKDFESLKKENPMAYKMFLKHLLMQKRELEGLKESDPERYELKKEILKLELKSKVAGRTAKTSESKEEKVKVKNELKTILNNLFDLREKDREFEIKRLEKEITELKEMMTERKNHKSEIIDEHLKDLLEEKEYMRW